MEKCPKCGFKRIPEDKKCPECGVIYEIYSYYLGSQQDSSEDELAQTICPSCGETILKSLTSCPTCEALLCFNIDSSSHQEERFEKLKTYSYGQCLLREREYIFEKIYAEEELNDLIRHFAFYSLLFSAVYGLFLGMYAGNYQILAALIKIPLLVFGTLCVCLPVFHVLNVLFGIKLSFKQILAILMASTYFMSVILGATSPILLFFISMTEVKRFISLLNITAFATSCFFGLRLLRQGMQYMRARSSYHSKIHVTRIWYVIYVLIGIQLAWILRPFVGEKGHFALFREIEGNFYLSLLNKILSILN